MCEARHRNHRSLAHVTDPDNDPDRRAWHQAHAAPRPNEDAYALLDSVLSRPLTLRYGIALSPGSKGPASTATRSPTATTGTPANAVPWLMRTRSGRDTFRT